MSGGAQAAKPSGGVPPVAQCDKAKKPAPGHLTVIVLDHKGNRLPDADVRVAVAASGASVGSNKTAATGQRTFWCLDPVLHKVKAWKQDYETVFGSKTVVSGTTVTLTLVLRPLLKDVQIVTIRYLTDNQEIRTKYDNWKDPANAGENMLIAHFKPEYKRGQNSGKALPVSHTWDKKIELEVEVDVTPEGCVPEDGVLSGTSALGHLSFKSGKTTFSPGRMPVRVTANAELPKKIDVVDDYAIQWSTKTDRITISDSGTSKHEIYVVAGPIHYAQSWPMINNNGNHNYPTAFRMKHAAKTAIGKTAFHDIVKALHASYGGEYDLGAPGNLNPWNLAASGTRAQCMTICAFMESAAGLLGLEGRVVYVWPNFDDPGSGGEMTKAWNAGAGAWAAASPTFVSQKRTVTAPPHTSSTQHHKYSPAEWVAMVDHATTGTGQWVPGWNNYEATFRFTDSGVTKYYGGGGPIENSPVEVLDKVCAVVTWCYSTSISGRTFCNPPGPCKWWKVVRPWPPSTMSSEHLPG